MRHVLFLFLLFAAPAWAQGGISGNNGGISGNNGALSTITDGTTTVGGVQLLTVAGATVGGTTPNATLTVGGGITNGTYGALMSNTGAPTAGGTGYTALTAFTVSGGTCSTQPKGVIDAVSGGVVTVYHITQPGACSVVPPVVSQTTASGGSGMTVTLLWGPNAANVLYPAFTSGGVNVDTFLGYLAGANRVTSGLGSTGYGAGTCGGGLNTGDGMGGGTGMTSGENTCLGNLAGTQMVGGNYVFFAGHNAGGHEVAGQQSMAVGTDAGKWLFGSNRFSIVGSWNTGTYLQTPAYGSVFGSNVAPGGVVLNVPVTGTASGTAGVVRLTLASTTGMATGDVAVVSNVGGTTEANGRWTGITVVDSTHIDLTGGPAYVHAWTSGGGVNTFATVGMQNVALFGENVLSNNAMRSVGPFSFVGTGSLNAVTTAKNVVGGGSSVLTGLTVGTQHVAFGDASCNTLVNGNGDVCLGYGSDVAAAAYNAVAIGGTGNGGGTGAVASNSGTTVGARSGSRTMGGNMQIFGPQQGNECGSGNYTAIIIGDTSSAGVGNAGCGTNSFTNFLAVSWDGGVTVNPAARNSFSLGNIIYGTGTGTPSTSATNVAGTFNVVGLYKANGTSGVSCAANTITISTFVVTNGIVTHC